MAAVSVIIVNWNTRALLAQCIESVRTTAAGDVEIVVVDNASADGSVAMVRECFPAARLLANAENRGFAAANNQAVAATDRPFILLLNSDAELTVGTLAALVDVLAQQPRAAAVGAQLRDFDGSFQASHAAFPSLAQSLLVQSGVGRLLYGAWYPNDGPRADATACSVDWVGGACVLVRRSAFDAVGGFDESYFLYSEEMDLCYRLRAAGWQVWYQPAAVARHRGGGSSSGTSREALLYGSQVRFFRKHYGAPAAALLKSEIYAFTAIKRVVHGLLHLGSRGRYGRMVVPLRELRRQLRDV